MKVSKTRGAGSAPAGSAVRAEAAYRSAEATQARPAPPAEDVATVVGIPEAELTPKVRQALQQLMAEVYALRQELEEVRQRAGYLEQLAAPDTLAPVLTPPPFLPPLGPMAASQDSH